MRKIISVLLALLLTASLVLFCVSFISRGIILPAMDEDALACFLRNMLCLALPGQTVLWLYRQFRMPDHDSPDKKISEKF